MFKVGILTVSDSGAKGAREDKSGPFIEDFLHALGGFKVNKKSICPDEKEDIRSILIDWVDNLKLDLIVTTGGTGLSPRDVTPEATKTVLDKEIPGIAEAIRIYGLNKTPRAMLSRAVAGSRKDTLIINLPGSLKAVEDGLNAIKDVLEHAILKIKGDTRPCGE